MSRLLGGDHLSIDAPARFDLGVGICDEEPVEAIPFSVIEELGLGGIASRITKASHSADRAWSRCQPVNFTS